ncbi:hypothetical protein MLD38_030520 [Melastoma candidum]|uniref:Uncharacterized protein n=1 Tax=Melastoma candidum TaxID=119954 RepID=A0ACB9MM21_9MYRT|nr:hypothetical protein MLD38_030520 [Melastoma candidum]
MGTGSTRLGIYNNIRKHCHILWVFRQCEAEILTLIVCYLELRTTTMPARTSAGSPPSTWRMKSLSPWRTQNVLLLLSLLFITYLLLANQHARTPPSTLLLQNFPPPSSTTTAPTTRSHLLFSIASSSLSLPRRGPFLRLWFSPNTTRALAFLEPNPNPNPAPYDPSLPPAVPSHDSSHFPYTFPGGLRSAVRLARIVKEVVDRREPDVRWYVFGDDDTVFFVDNLVSVLRKYDHTRWYYVGSNSENYEQNARYSFEMGFGGGGFVISSSLAEALARVMDGCLVRYAHLYGSDARVFSCVAELGVGLTHEPGFHQIDMRGDLFGLLTAHPLSPLVSLHHMEAVDTIFPTMNKTEAMEHLFKAANVDPARILQQNVCYDRANSLTVSVSWGYVIQVYEGNILLPDLLSVQKSFSPWRRSRSAQSHYMFNLRDLPRDPCERPVVFFLDNIISEENGAQSDYVRHISGNCVRGNIVRNLKRITVFSRRLEQHVEEMKAPRRQCCDVLPIVNGSMIIHLRRCGEYEVISMSAQ